MFNNKRLHTCKTANILIWSPKYHRWQKQKKTVYYNIICNDTGFTIQSLWKSMEKLQEGMDIKKTQFIKEIIKVDDTYTYIWKTNYKNLKVSDVNKAEDWKDPIVLNYFIQISLVGKFCTLCVRFI